MRQSKINPFFVRLGIASLLVFCWAMAARAGGPSYVAGTTYFNAGTAGQPITWPLGVVNYYTDQGDLSPIFPNSAANALVANSFAQWTSVSIAAVTANAAGQLEEDVNGSNIQVDANGTVIAPADITPSATGTPVGIVYDYDGSVTDALLGQGAGDSSECFWNAVYGGPDNFSTSANFSHALVVINGQCALNQSQTTDVEYRLARVLGSVLGLGWSQNNLNVITGNPHPTAADYAGFPVMHYLDPVSCVPITLCYANPYQLAPDDMAALSRLYPSSPASMTARVYGSVYFVNHIGAIAQPMQGVNVVARWIDPSTNQPSDQYSATSVSGFLFTGNAGNLITGWNDPLGTPYSQFGSSNQTIEGFFDLGGLPVPNAATTAQYQLTIEALDREWSAGVCPYDLSQVAPSGAMQPVTVTVTAGGEFEQDILMSGSAQPVPQWAAPGTWTAPAVVPTAGDWVGSLSGYGDVGYFELAAQANRTLSVAVTALDESSSPSESKASPVIGMWTLGDAQGTPPPAFTPAPFNSEAFAMTRLDAQILSPETFLIAIADLRGDGRPDYRYHAHILYGDSASPGRLPVSGGTVTILGTGLSSTLAVAVGNTSASPFAANAGQLTFSAPAQRDGPQTITLTDPVSGAFSIMTNAVTFGAAPTDTISLLQGGNPPTPVGTQATNPVIVRVFASDGITPVNGATVAWSTTNGALLSGCAGATTCSALTDESGFASTLVTPAATGTASITAALAPATYNPPQSVTGTLSATSTSLDIGVTTPYLFIAQGASVSVPLTAQVVSLGIPKPGMTVDFIINQGSGSLSAQSAVTNGSGLATVNLSETNLGAGFQISACVAGGTGPCQTIYGSAVALASLNLQFVSGAAQTVSGTNFQPLTVRVTDSSTPPNPVLGASVTFQSTVTRMVGSNPAGGSGDPSSGQTGSSIILSASQSSALSDGNGLASITPSLGSFTGALEIQFQISAGISALLQDVLQSIPPASN